MRADGIEKLNLGCLTCGHWKVGYFTKDEVADWLRTHPAGRIREGRGPDRQSTCPHPCGTPFDPTAAARSGEPS